MENLLKAILLHQEYEALDFEKFIAEFEKYTKQNIPTKALRDFKFSGLSKMDLLTSDFLNKYGVNNLIQTAMLWEGEGLFVSGIQRVICILYVEGKIHCVYSEYVKYSKLLQYDFDKDAHDESQYIFTWACSGGEITEIQAPNFIEGANAQYWIAPDAAFEGTPKNCEKLDAPLIFKDNICNPFELGRYVNEINYCKICDKYYDEYLCSDHHNETEEGVFYDDGTPLEN